jgi:hypothetical protein
MSGYLPPSAPCQCGCKRHRFPLARLVLSPFDEAIAIRLDCRARQPIAPKHCRPCSSLPMVPHRRACDQNECGSNPSAVFRTLVEDLRTFPALWQGGCRRRMTKAIGRILQPLEFPPYHASRSTCFRPRSGLGECIFGSPLTILENRLHPLAMVMANPVLRDSSASAGVSLTGVSRMNLSSKSTHAATRCLSSLQTSGSESAKFFSSGNRKLPITV